MLDFWSDPDPFVLYGHSNPIRVAVAADGDRPTLLTRLQGVLQQIEQHAPQPVGVSGDRPLRRLGQLGGQSDTALLSLSTNQLNNLRAQHFIQTLRLRKDLGILFIDEKGMWQ